jgi:predicted ATPase
VEGTQPDWTQAVISPTRPLESAEQLLERLPQLDALADALRAVKRTRRGRLVLVGGEAGIGKSALVQAFCLSLASARVLAGACEALQTARPLGPLADIASETGGELAWLVERRPGRSQSSRRFCPSSAAVRQRCS